MHYVNFKKIVSMIFLGIISFTIPLKGQTFKRIDTFSETIVGNTATVFNKKETYSYALKPGSTAIWEVEGGTILSGQGTASIDVVWKLEEHGVVKIIEQSAQCQSQLQTLNVALSVKNVSEKISIARLWNEVLLDAIRVDFARPTLHARNLFHSSVAMYDIWAFYTKKGNPYLIGNTVNGFKSELNSFEPEESEEASIHKAISYAMFRLLSHRFASSPGAEKSFKSFRFLMEQLGYDTDYNSLEYESGNAAAFGNYVAQQLIDYGLQDGSNEKNSYTSQFYEPINNPLDLNGTGTIDLIDPNRWQPLRFDTFIDQSGNLISGNTPKFLGPEWGNVSSFALSDLDKEIFTRNGNKYTTYHNPTSPPQLSLTESTVSSDQYKWNFSLVSVWSSQLDPEDGVMWDISPKKIGNIDFNSIPTSAEDYPKFYNLLDGGDISKGHSLNPVTQKPYETQMVPRADYARVLAEFWADGPESETPPGHWFTILNYVTDHPLFVRKFHGEGIIISPLEWDVKAYFVLGGAMHDAAVTAWGIKGWNDYIRPVSAIRFMSSLGQSTDPNLPNYHVGGIPLLDGFIEQIKEGDPLAGYNNVNVGKIKVYAWKGHSSITDATTDVGGVGWIFAKNWFPYQRPSFVTPPFAGFISGHSTFSRAAAEVLTLLTGDEFFPGGMGEFVAKKDTFLAFEKGPSVDVTLQWATYRDASDQTSLSRIWGGIHPPADDLPGRIIGKKIGIDAFQYALTYFSGEENLAIKQYSIYPNPIVDKQFFVKDTHENDSIELFDFRGQKFEILSKTFHKLNKTTLVKLPKYLKTGVYVLKINANVKLFVVQ